MSDDHDDDLPVHPALAEPEADEPETEEAERFDDDEPPRTPSQQVAFHQGEVRDRLSGDMEGVGLLAGIIGHGLLGVMAALRVISNDLDRTRRDVRKLTGEIGNARLADVRRDIARLRSGK